MAKELFFDIKEALSNGLAPDPQLARNQPYLATMKNAKPRPGAGAVSHEWVTKPNAGVMDWPFPVFMWDPKTPLYCGTLDVSTVDVADSYHTNTLPMTKAISFGSELMANGGFETWPSGLLATGWTNMYGTPSKETTAPYAGTNSQKFTAVSNAAYSGIRSPDVTLTSGLQYRLTFALKVTTGTTLAMVRLATGQEIAKAIGTSAWALYTYDFVAAASGVTNIDFLTNPLNAASVWLIDAVSIKVINRGSDTATLTRDSTMRSWQIAAFENLWFLSDAKYLLWSIPSNYQDNVYVSSDITVQALAACDNRVVMGGVAGAFFTTSRWTDLFNAWRNTRSAGTLVHEDMAFSTNWIFWAEHAGGASDIPFKTLVSCLGLMGGEEFDRYRELFLSAIESGEIGMLPSNCGNIRAIKQLGDYVMVYGSKGVSRLIRDGSGYAEDRITAVSIMDRNTIAGDERQHLFLESNGDLMLMAQDDQKPQRLGFGQYLSTLTHDEVIMSFDALLREWWISDGTTSYVFTREGKLGGPMDVCPTSLHRSGATLVGMAKGIDGTHELHLKTLPFDLDKRDRKTAQLIQVATGGLTSVKTRMGLRYTAEATERFSPWVPANMEGVTFNRAQFLDGSIEVKGNINATTHRASVERVQLRYLSDDVRFRRGTSAATDQA